MSMLSSERQAGFTLIELVITVTVATAGIIAIVGIFITVDKLNRQARNFAIATQLAQQKAESYRNLIYSAIPASEDFTSSLPTNFGSPKSATASFHDLSPAVDGLKKLDIVIYYKDSNVRKDVQVSTLIAQRGIDK